MNTVDEICPRCHGFVWHRQEPCACKPTELVSLPAHAEFLLAVGGRMKAARLARNLSLDALARATGLSKTGLWEIEKGKHEPMARTLAALATALAVTTDYLIFGKTQGE